jgi:hypothetical protein
MKEKDNKGEELERINDELFGSFDPKDEASIGGGPYTLTSSLTLSGGSFDHQADIDWNFEELKPEN